MAHWLRSAAITLLGIVLSLVPPALWIAWTETILFGVAAVGLVSAALLVMLADQDAEAEERQAGASIGMRRKLSVDAILELHRIFPLTYHHSLVEKTRFRRAMDKVRKLLD
jgi:hypothetical protein